MTIHNLGIINDFEKEKTYVFQLDNISICVIMIDNKLYAFSNECSHEKYALEDGYIDFDDKTVECSKHGAVFDIISGKPLSLPATNKINTYKIWIKDNNIMVDI